MRHGGAMVWASVLLELLLHSSAAGLRRRGQAELGRSLWLGATAVLGPPVLAESCQGDPRASYTVAVVLAGRQSTMHVLIEYLDMLVSQCHLHEVHIWDYCRNENDRDWLLHAVARHPGFEILIPSGGNASRKWEEMYQYYAPPAANESSVRAHFRPRLDGVAAESTVIVKMDDDIVFIDTGRFPAFLGYIRGHPRTFIVHANIVNNGVAAFYQAGHLKLLRAAFPELRRYPVSRRGVVGMDGPLLNGPEVATELHRMFLLAPEKFAWEGRDGDSCVAFQSPDRKPGSAGQGRFSINFFGALWRAWGSMPALVKVQGDDEQAITLGATAKGFTECMFTPFNVVHHKFRTQGPIPRYIMEAYEDLLAKWKGDAPDERWPDDAAVATTTAVVTSAPAAQALTVGAAGRDAVVSNGTAAPGARAEPALPEASKPTRVDARTATTSRAAVPVHISTDGSTHTRVDPSILAEAWESWFGRDGPLRGLLDGAIAKQPALPDVRKPTNVDARTVSTSPSSVPVHSNGGGSAPLLGEASELPEALEGWFRAAAGGPVLAGHPGGAAAGAGAGSAGPHKAAPLSEAPAADFLTAAQAISKWLAS